MDDELSISVEFTCKCKKQKGWIEDRKLTKPCPTCGRQYVGKYDPKKYTTHAVEVVVKKRTQFFEKIKSWFKNIFG